MTLLQCLHCEHKGINSLDWENDQYYYRKMRLIIVCGASSAERNLSPYEHCPVYELEKDLPCRGEK